MRLAALASRGTRPHRQNPEDTLGAAKGPVGPESSVVSLALGTGLQTASLSAEQGSDKQEHHGHFVGPAPGAWQGHWGSSTQQAGGSDGSSHLWVAAVPLRGTTSKGGTTASERGVLRQAQRTPGVPGRRRALAMLRGPRWACCSHTGLCGVALGSLPFGPASCFWWPGSPLLTSSQF